MLGGEGDDRRGAAAGRRPGGAVEIVGGHHPARGLLLDMAVAVDAARQDQPAGRVDVARALLQPAAEGHDDPVADADVGLELVGRRDDAAVADDEVEGGHAVSSGEGSEGRGRDYTGAARSRTAFAGRRVFCYLRGNPITPERKPPWPRPRPSSPGVYAAVLTPLTPTRAGREGLRRPFALAARQSLAPLGTTGEANSLSVDHRLKLIEASAEAGLPGDRTIFGTGSCSLADAVRVSRAAVSAGAAGVLLLPPFYYKNVDEDGLFAFFSEIVQRVADPRLRMYLYHFPQQAVIPITLSLVERLKKAYPGETVAGLKDSSGKWDNTESFIRTFPGFGVFSGSEQFLLPNLRAGSVGLSRPPPTSPPARPEGVLCVADGRR
jgi:hypothetical protein